VHELHEKLVSFTCIFLYSCTNGIVVLAVAGSDDVQYAFIISSYTRAQMALLFLLLLAQMMFNMHLSFIFLYSCTDGIAITAVAGSDDVGLVACARLHLTLKGVSVQELQGLVHAATGQVRKWAALESQGCVSAHDSQGRVSAGAARPGACCHRAGTEMGVKTH
jgi:hypothetical protein